MDIIIMFLLLITAAFMLLDVSRPLIMAAWLITTLLSVGLFNHHVTSALNLSY